MTCKDCIHYEACKSMVEATLFDVEIDETYNAAEDCPNFADKSLYIKLPCKVNDTVYSIRGFNGQLEDCERYTIANISVEDSYGTLMLHLVDGLFFTRDLLTGEIGKTLFFTREEAEAALKEGENGKQTKTD